VELLVQVIDEVIEQLTAKPSCGMPLLRN
jgi:hypothetical protein